MSKYSLTAVIPTVQYGNVQPTIEGDDLAKIEAEMRVLWDKYASEPLKVKEATTQPEGSDTSQNSTSHMVSAQEITTFTNEKIRYNDISHTYYDLEGNELMSASTHAQKYAKPFNREALLPVCAKAWGVKAEDIAEIWDMNSEVSTLYGSSLHKALELYAEHSQDGRKIIDAKIAKGKEPEGAPNYVLPNHPYLAQVVKDFYNLPQPTGVVHSEVFLSCIRDGIAGQADRILQTGENTYRVQDFKTGKEIDKEKKKVYQIQMSTYADMIKKAGMIVEEDMDIFHHDGKEWSIITVPVVEVNYKEK